MRAWRAVPALLGWVAAGGCGAGGGDGAAYVLMDQEARQAGVELRVDGRAVSPSSLPVEVPDPTSRVELAARGRATERVDLAGGTLLWVRGAAAARRELALGADVRPDAIYIAADEDFARRFAGALGAAAPVAEASGMWAIEGEQAFVRSAWMSAPPEVVEAEPVGGGGASPRAETGVAGAPAGGSLAGGALGSGPRVSLGAAFAAAGPGSRGGEHERARPGLAGTSGEDVTGGGGDATAVVLPGLYRAVAPGGARSLLLDAEGGFRWESGWGDRCGGRDLRVGSYQREDDRLVLDTIGVVITIRADGTLEHDGEVLTAEDPS